MNTQTGSDSNIVVWSSTEYGAGDSLGRESYTGDGTSQSASLVPGQITSPVPGQYTSIGSGHDFACSVRSGRKSCQGDIINKVPELVFQDNENANQNMLCGTRNVIKKNAAKPSMSVD